MRLRNGDVRSGALLCALYWVSPAFGEGVSSKEDANPAPAAVPASRPQSEPASTAHSKKTERPKKTQRPEQGAAKEDGDSERKASKPKANRKGLTLAQERGLNELLAESEVFEKAARNYERLLTRVVEHHFAEQRRRVIDGLEKEIDAEQDELVAARDEAIRRFEQFVAKYEGANADREATPDAMYRLAALYEERARTDFDTELADTLKPALALYRRIILEYPDYEEIAGVHYYLGHAYADALAFEESQQVFRSLVCANRYQVKDAAGGGIALQPLPQDHADDFWLDWESKNPLPLDQLPGRSQRNLKDDVSTRDEELVFIDPYVDCQALPQEVKDGEEPRYVAETWWKIGNHHFDQLGPGGPYAFNRAASAYAQSMVYEKPPIRGVALYKRAWTYFKQQRYGAATRWFVELLQYADELEKETGDAGVDFRAEAYTYIATSLTYVDFDGPREQDPYIPRADVLDIEENPTVAEKKMRVAIDRVQDPAIIPQDAKWTVEIYKALAREFVDITQQKNAIEMLALTLQRFPLDRDAPELQNRVAELYDEIASLAPAGSPLREEATALALAARTELARFVGDTAWTRANRDDQEALTLAEQLVRQGLQQAAADHTNGARALAARAEQVGDPFERQILLEKALEQYALAAKGWRAFIDQDPNGIDAYESRFWLADARYSRIVLQLELGRIPQRSDVKSAIEAAAAVRDSNEDDRFLQPAAYYVVAIADKVLEARYREHELSGGTRGFQKREEVTFQGTGMSRSVVRLPIPEEVLDAVAARDDYNRRIALGSDPEKNGILYAFQAAESFFVYGDFEKARERLEPLMKEYCGRNEWGYRAWEKLISMSNFSRDAEQSRALAEGQSCAFDEATRAAEDAIRTPVISGVAYLDARKLYDEAQKMSAGEERDAKWREAASAYNVALEASPDRDEAPEAAMNGAFAYKQVGEYDKAIEMYELFLARYATEAKLEALKHGDTSTDPPVEPNPESYDARVKFSKMAYDALANAYVLFFDYPKAAETFDRIAGVDHFAEEQRREAAQQAISLYASLGDQAGMQRSQQAFLNLGASPSEAARADFLVKSAPLKLWDPLSPDEGGNARARADAEAAMRSYYQANRNNPAAFEHAVEAAYWVAKAKAASGSGEEVSWWQEAVGAFDLHRQTAPQNPDGTSTALGSRSASLAAEGAYRLLDEQIKKSFDYDSGRHRFKGTPQEVLEQYRAAAKEAKAWFDRLQLVVDDYASPEWGTAAVARQGTLYDSLRSALYNTRAPELVMFDAKTEALLRKAEESDNLELQEKADALRVKAEGTWQETRDREIAAADQVMVDRYARAIWMARRFNVTNPAIVRSIQRLAFFTEVIGEARMQSYMQRVPELGYREGMFLRIRPGLVTAPAPEGLVPAAPSQAGRP